MFSQVVFLIMYILVFTIFGHFGFLDGKNAMSDDSLSIILIKYLNYQLQHVSSLFFPCKDCQ